MPKTVSTRTYRDRGITAEGLEDERKANVATTRRCRNGFEVTMEIATNSPQSA